MNQKMMNMETKLKDLSFTFSVGGILVAGPGGFGMTPTSENFFKNMIFWQKFQLGNPPYLFWKPPFVILETSPVNALDPKLDIVDCYQLGRLFVVDLFYTVHNAQTDEL